MEDKGQCEMETGDPPVAMIPNNISRKKKIIHIMSLCPRDKNGFLRLEYPFLVTKKL